MKQSAHPHKSGQSRALAVGNEEKREKHLSIDEKKHISDPSQRNKKKVITMGKSTKMIRTKGSPASKPEERVESTSSLHKASEIRLLPAVDDADKEESMPVRVRKLQANEKDQEKNQEKEKEQQNTNVPTPEPTKRPTLFPTTSFPSISPSFNPASTTTTIIPTRILEPVDDIPTTKGKDPEPTNVPVNLPTMPPLSSPVAGAEATVPSLSFVGQFSLVLSVVWTGDAIYQTGQHVVRPSVRDQTTVLIDLLKSFLCNQSHLYVTSNFITMKDDCLEHGGRRLEPTIAAPRSLGTTIPFDEVLLYNWQDRREKQRSFYHNSDRLHDVSIVWSEPAGASSVDKLSHAEWNITYTLLQLSSEKTEDNEDITTTTTNGLTIQVFQESLQHSLNVDIQNRRYDSVLPWSSARIAVAPYEVADGSGGSGGTSMSFDIFPDSTVKALRSVGSLLLAFPILFVCFMVHYSRKRKQHRAAAPSQQPYNGGLETADRVDQLLSETNELVAIHSTDRSVRRSVASGKDGRFSGGNSTADRYAEEEESGSIMSLQHLYPKVIAASLGSNSSHSGRTATSQKEVDLLSLVSSSSSSSKNPRNAPIYQDRSLLVEVPLDNNKSNDLFLMSSLGSTDEDDDNTDEGMEVVSLYYSTHDAGSLAGSILSHPSMPTGFIDDVDDDLDSMTCNSLIIPKTDDGDDKETKTTITSSGSSEEDTFLSCTSKEPS